MPPQQPHMVLHVCIMIRWPERPSQPKLGRSASGCAWNVALVVAQPPQRWLAELSPVAVKGGADPVAAQVRFSGLVREPEAR